MENPAVQDFYPSLFARCYGCGRLNADGLHVQGRALAVGADVTYVTVEQVKQDGAGGQATGGQTTEKLILAKDLLSSALRGEYTVVEEYKGKKLVGKRYLPLYTFLPVSKDYCYVIEGDFVSTTDGTGIVHTMEQVGESWSFVVDAPAELARYLAYKGSVAVNGVALTGNRVEDVAAGTAQACCRIWINLIPHTIEVTTLRDLKPGDRVNLEVDMIARYLEGMLPAALRG